MAPLVRALTTLVHGASKSGKSTLSVTGPAPRLYLDVESASRFLPINPILWDPARDKPPEPDGTWDTAVVPTRDWGTVEKAYQWLASGQHPFRSLAVDSISELQQRHIEMIGHRQQMTQAQWGDTFRAVTGLLRDLRDLTMHPTRPIETVVVTAMTRQLDGMWRPWCQGQTATMLPYLMDITAYLWVEQVPNELTGEVTEVRKLLTRRMPQFEAGERVQGRIPSVLELSRVDGSIGQEGDIGRMVDMIFGGRPDERAAPAPEPEPEIAEAMREETT